MRTLDRFEAARQPIAVVQRADRWSSVRSQPGLDQALVLDREIVADQHVTQDDISTVDLEAEASNPDSRA